MSKIMVDRHVVYLSVLFGEQNDTLTDTELFRDQRKQELTLKI